MTDHSRQTKRETSASHLCWGAASKPQVAEKFKQECIGQGICATCGKDITGLAVTVQSIDNASFSERHESFRFKSPVVCMGCAWLYGAGPSKPGNFFCTPDRFEQAETENVFVDAEDKSHWLGVAGSGGDMTQLQARILANRSQQGAA